MLKLFFKPSPHATPPAHAYKISPPLAALFFLISAIRLWLTDAQAVLANYYPHDDFLFIRLAESLASGNWLGKYDQLTLVKYPFYPAWIAGTHKLGIPLLLSQHILYLTACIAAVTALRPLLATPKLQLALYAILIFSPMSYANGLANRVTRESVYTSLTLLACAGAAGLMLRHDRSFKSMTVWAVLLGVSGTCFWLTREEGVWLLPPILFFLGLYIIRLWQARPARLLPGLALCLIPGVIYFLAANEIKNRNLEKYGAPFLVETKTAEFLSTYGALSRVRHEEWNPRVPLPRETRNKLYKVSPAFSELSPYLEGSVSNQWLNRWPAANTRSKEISGGYFSWAFRDAIAAAGYYSSWPRVQDYYIRLAGEINAACETKTLDCLPPRNTLAPPWHHEYIVPFIKSFFKIFADLVELKWFSPSTPEVPTQKPVFDIIRKMTGEAYEKPRDDILIRGWAFGLHSPIELMIINEKGERIPSALSRIERLDIFSRFYIKEGHPNDNAINSGFYIRTGRRDDIYVAVKDGNDILGRLPAKNEEQLLETGGIRLSIESSETLQWDWKKKLGLEKARIDILWLIGNFYILIFPIVFLASLLLYILFLRACYFSRVFPLALAVPTILLCSVAFRLAILAFIDISSFEGGTLRYLAPAYPLLLMFSLLTLIAVRRSSPGPK